MEELLHICLEELAREYFQITGPTAIVSTVGNRHFTSRLLDHWTPSPYEDDVREEDLLSSVLVSKLAAKLAEKGIQLPIRP